MPNNLKFSSDYFGINNANDQYKSRLLTFSESVKVEERARIRALIEAAPELLEALQGVTRILEAFSYTTTLGKTQAERLAAVQALIAKVKGA